MSHLIEDLRFFIGVFFLMIGLLLVGESFMVPSMVEGINVNLWVGLSFLAFSVSSLALVFFVYKGRSNA